MEYQFNQTEHIHQIKLDKVWENLIGTSQMATVLSKGGLTYWASGEAVKKFGWIHPGDKKKGFVPKEERLAISTTRKLEVEKLSPEEYLALLDEAYKAHASTLKTSATKGTDLHAECEKYVKWKINGGSYLDDSTPNFDKKILPFIQWAEKNVKKFLASEIHTYSKELWLGGIVDCVYEDMDGKIVVLDFKSSKEVYLSQFWQCVAYAIELQENGGFTPEGEKILEPIKADYVAVLPFGMDKPEVQFNFDMVGGTEAVKAMVLLYKKLN